MQSPSTRENVLNLLCAALQHKVVSVPDLQNVSSLYPEKNMRTKVRSSSLELVVEALREGIFSVEDLKEAARRSIEPSRRINYGGGFNKPAMVGLDNQNVSYEPGDWLCDKCGNLNFARRTECHRDSCKAPRPSGERGKPIERYIPPARLYSPPPRYSPPPLERYDPYRSRPSIESSNPRGYGPGYQQGQQQNIVKQEGDWICKKCGNLNFARRTECHRGSCKAPRD